MEAKVQSKTKLSKPRWKKILLIVSTLFVFLVVLVFLIIPMFISSEKGRRIILAKINNSIDGQTDFSDLSVGWLKGIRIADLSFKDDVGQISVKVKNITTKPHYSSLLTGNINLGQTNIDMPQVEINLKDGLPATTAPETEVKSVPKESAGIALVTDITVNDGNVKITGADSKTVELEQINSNVSLRPPGQQSSLDLDMIVATNNEKSTVKANAQVTPPKSKGWTFKNTDCDIEVNVGGVDLESLEPFLEMAGVDIKAKGNVSVDIKSSFIAGQIENISGTIKGSQLEIETGQNNEAIKTAVLDVDLELNQKQEMINIEKVQVKTDWAQIQAKGAVPVSVKSLDSFLSSNANYDLNGTFNCDLATVISQIPTTVGLKKGTEISSGTITGSVNTIGTVGQKQIQAQVELADLTGTVDGKQISLSAPVRAETQISPDQKGVNFKKLVVSSSFAQINAAGNLEQIKFDGQADLAKLQSELDKFVDIGPYKLTGQFIETGQVSLADKNIQLSGSSTIKGLKITGPNNVTASMPTGDVTYTLNLDKQNSILNVKSLDAGMDFGQVNIKNAVVPLKKDATSEFNIKLNAEQIDLNKLQPFAVLFGGMPEDIKLTGIAKSQVSINSKKQIYTIQSDSTRIDNLKVTYEDRKPFEKSYATAQFKIEMDAEGKTRNKIFFKLDSPDMNVPEANVSQVEENGKTKLSGQVELQYDWSALYAIAGPYLPEDLELKGRRTDKISFESEYPTEQKDKLLSNLNAKAAVGFQQANYKGLNFGQTDVGIEVENGLLEISPFSTVVNEGQLNFAANADFKEKPALFKTSKPMQIVKDIKINDEMTKKLLKYINPIFAEAVNVNGIANLNCEKLSIPLDSAAKNKAEIVGTVSISQLQMQTSDFLGQILNLFGSGAQRTNITIHPTKFTLKKGFLSYDDMQMDIGDNPVNFRGVIGLDKSLDMSITLPYTIEGRTIRIGEQNAGRITLPITGTVDKPELDTGKLLENTLKQELPNLLQKGLEELFK